MRNYSSLLASAVLCWTVSSPIRAQDVPDFMKIVVTNQGAPVAKANQAYTTVYALNEGMFPIYGRSQALYQKHVRERVPLIMGLFGAKGGRFILYRPGQEPLEAPSPPPVYALAKSVGHCAMATYTLVAPYVGNSATDQTWKPEMVAYRSYVQNALGALDDTDIAPQDRQLLSKILKQVAGFMDQCLAKGSFTYQEVETYARTLKPDLAKLIELASSTQVAHWFKVLDGWKALLGKDWDNTYGLVNSIYVARQNNILYSTLVQYMGEKAINDRLLLLETTDFTTTPDMMMEAFCRIISDRALGKVFFNDYRLMDTELLGGGGRQAIQSESAKRGWQAVLPPLVPYNSNEWPWHIDPKSGTGATLMEEVK